MKDQSIDSKRIARWINERGLQDIAAFLLVLVRPFGIFIAQTTYFLEPLLGGRNAVIRDFTIILEDSEQMEELLDQLNLG
jgi:predicted PurR-regulated permease PerM